MAVIAVTLASALAGDVAGAAAAPPDERPNVVMIVTDDQTLGSYADDVMPHTKNLIEGSGTRFANAFVTTPLCCPSRATMLTGQYGHNNGVLANEYGALRDKANTLPVWLQAAGYRTMHVGRYLNFYEAATAPHEVAPGWDVWRTITERNAYFDYSLELGGRSVPYGDDDSNYSTRVINERASRLVRKYGPDPKPFYLQIDQIAPHQASGTRSVGCKSSPIPDPRDRKRFRDRPLPMGPSFNETDNADKPPFVQGLPELDASDMRRITRRWRCTLASLRAVDRGVRDLFGALEEAGELSNTIVIFVSDNGYFFGEHRISDKKHNPYEEAIRVPMAIRLPKSLRAGTPRIPVVEETVANIDLAPTVLQFAKAEPCSAPGSCRTMDGRSMVALLRGRELGWPAERNLIIELARVGVPTDVGGHACAYQGVRTPGPSGAGSFYVEHTSAVAASGSCEPVDERELYDLAADPFELENGAVAPPDLGSDDLRTPLQVSLSARLADLRDCAGLPGRDQRPASGHFCE
ncbi:MAG: sulfatase family protein [Solirubrobacterales bacterium]